MAAARKTTTAEKGDLLGEISDDTPATQGVQLDLLDQLDDSAATAWVPEEAGEGIEGTVTYVGTVASEYTDEPVPLIELRDDAGTDWSLRGYHSVLAREISKADPQVGDRMAAKFFGEKDGKGGQRYKHYKVAVRRAAHPTAAAPATTKAPF